MPQTVNVDQSGPHGARREGDHVERDQVESNAGPGEFELRAGDYTAVVTAHAGALRKLTYRGRDLVVPFAQGGPIPDYRGIIAAPWPNRLADGEYTYDGATHHVPLNEPERGCALHGFAFTREWSLVRVDERSVTLAISLNGPGSGDEPGYPFDVRLEASYALDGGASPEAGGLTWEVRASNAGADAAPYGVCPHPYLIAGESPLDEWILELPADTYLEVTPDRLLPVGERPLAGHAFDFRAARPLGATQIDHAFTDIAFDDDGAARVLVRDPVHRTGVGMAWDRTCPWIQVHTADKLPPAPNRLGLAVEPMTCPPDAFTSGTDVIRLEPGASHKATWRIFATDL
ncbi:aldose 1-epimerase family protein [Sinomonas albida]|uniref:aldose 1-epimerase family protein n=1 Tax=Sinomonas albida TaxID=369942 RepID=UPI0010A7ECEA|nr:aldose 1-epimerase family protein [Sinomonas albida]